jgi:N-acetyl-D-muramate 6-phosphate phosphatase
MNGADARSVVLFDLDGTLIDSAPDLAGAANEMRTARGLATLPLTHFRPMVGSGARGMLARALDVGVDEPTFAMLRDEFLQRYEARMTQSTHVFDAVEDLLAGLARRSIRWGIVTNKASRFAVPLVAGLRALRGAATLVCGDTTPHAKPHPEPLLEAARRIGVEPGQCLYVGDDLRDVHAGRAAGMGTVAVRWGYHGDGDAIDVWNADAVIDAPDDLLKLLPIA